MNFLKNLLTLFSIVFISQMFFAQKKLPLIPYPQKVKIKSGFFSLEKIIEVNGEKKLVDYLISKNNDHIGIRLKKVKANKNPSIFISLYLNCLKTNKYEICKDYSKANLLEYSLSISENEINLFSYSNEGLFNGIQTLIQLFEYYKKEGKIPCMTIEDQPKFAWRGMHLDCARHFFSVEEVKKYIDYLAAYKLNTFHWHLTDDQGWRIEIKKYPKLTTIGANRKQTMAGHYSEQQYDDKPYSGFYTQEQIKKIVKYASDRYITVVPEIEMPGHAVAAIAAYPELGCTEKQLEVGIKWGVFEDVFCPKEETFTFLQNVLDEVMALFPSKIIHIGGDECPKMQWKQSEFCQNLIKEKKLKDEHGLQSYFIQRMEKYINSKGRKIIGWDEILEGGLAPKAAVMSWRGTEGGIIAAKQKHYVVMTPQAFCYFDHYQGEPKNEPVAIGGFTNLEKVYSFNPTDGMTTEEAKYVLGAQGNLWTEYIPNFNHVQYMLFPRVLALSEVLWGTSYAKDYKAFEKRIINHFQILDAQKINYSKSIFQISGEVKPSENIGVVMFQILSAQTEKGMIRYTTDKTLPNENSTIYKEPIAITESKTLNAAYFEGLKQKSNLFQQNFAISKSSNQKIGLANLPHETYNKGGAFTLVDGLFGDITKYGKNWLGFNGTDLVATIEFNIPQEISSLKTNFIKAEGSWIYLPQSLKIYISNDGNNFNLIKKISAQEIDQAKGIMNISFLKQKTKFMKIEVENFGKIPDGKEGAGNGSWLFVDELSIN